MKKKNKKVPYIKTTKSLLTIVKNIDEETKLLYKQLAIANKIRDIKHKGISFKFQLNDNGTSNSLGITEREYTDSEKKELEQLELEYDNITHKLNKIQKMKQIKSICKEEINNDTRSI